MHSVTVVGGIPIPSTSPLFLSIVAIHVLLGLSCALTGLVAMLSTKGRGRHSRFGTVYFWCLSGGFVTASALALVRWREDYPLFLLGTLSYAAAYLGRRALRHRWQYWPRLHLIGMGASYILLLTAFYVDNGKNLPLWRELPQIAFWLLPSATGFPIMLYVLRRHVLTREGRDKFRKPLCGTVPELGRKLEDRHSEHRMSEIDAEHRADNLGCDVSNDHCRTNLPAQCIIERDGRIKMCAGQRTED